MLGLLAALSTFTDSPASASHGPTSRAMSTPPSPPESFAPSYVAWTPCSDAASLTRAEWANCSTAYSTDRMRGTVTALLFVMVIFAVASFFLIAFRR
jgi:hypothetical protein